MESVAPPKSVQAPSTSSNDFNAGRRRRRSWLVEISTLETSMTRRLDFLFRNRSQFLASEMLFESCQSSPNSTSGLTSAMLEQKSHLLHQHHHQQQQQQAQTSSRILYDIPCKVCTDHSSGKHYGIFACDGCAGFFKRSIRRNRQYVCKSKSEGGCLVDKTHRNQCRACRLKRCVDVGMNREAVQHERGPRNSTLRRQMSLYFKEHHHHLATSAAAAETTTTTESPSPPPPPSSASPPHQYSPPPPHPHHQPSLPIPLLPPPLLQTSLSHLPPSYPFFVDPRLIPYFPSFNRHHQQHLLASPSSPKMGHEMSPPLPFLSPPPQVSHLSHLLLPPPPIQQQQQQQEGLSEAAARLLFMNVRWAQQIPAFTSLPYRDQLTLLEETWRELFVLSSAQFALPVELAAVAKGGQLLQQHHEGGGGGGLLDLGLLGELKAFQDTIHKFQSMGVDPTEFACLRAIVLLKTTLDSTTTTGEVSKRELRDQAAVNALQDQAQLTLSQYIVKAYPNQPQRFGKLLLLLPSLKSVTGRTIHSVFFRCIGAIPLEKLICDMFKAGGL